MELGYRIPGLVNCDFNIRISMMIPKKIEIAPSVPNMLEVRKCLKKMYV